MLANAIVDITSWVPIEAHFIRAWEDIRIPRCANEGTEYLVASLDVDLFAVVVEGMVSLSTPVATERAVEADALVDVGFEFLVGLWCVDLRQLLDGWQVLDSFGAEVVIDYLREDLRLVRDHSYRGGQDLRVRHVVCAHSCFCQTAYHVDAVGG